MTSNNKLKTPPKGGAFYPEIEVGPHFLTFYTRDYEKMLEDGKYLYTQLNAYLQLINPEGLEHKENDPNMYHPFGEPNIYRPHFRHFHIRYGQNIRLTAIREIKNIIRLNILDIPQNFTLSYLEDNRLPEFKDSIYPPVEGDYAEYIQMLRKGDWIKNGK